MEIKKEDKIVAFHERKGRIETVIAVEPSRIITYESAAKNSWYHPTKVFPVYWSEVLKKYVSIPED